MGKEFGWDSERTQERAPVSGIICAVGPSKTGGRGVYDPVVMGAFLARLAKECGGAPVAFASYRNTSLAINGNDGSGYLADAAVATTVKYVYEILQGKPAGDDLRFLPNLDVDGQGLPSDPGIRAWYEEIKGAMSADETLAEDVRRCVPKGLRDERQGAERYAALELGETARAFSEGFTIKAGYEREKVYDQVFRNVLDGKYGSLSSLARRLNPAGRPSGEIFGAAYWDRKFRDDALQKFASVYEKAMFFETPYDARDVQFRRRHPRAYFVARLVSDYVRDSAEAARLAELELRNLALHAPEIQGAHDEFSAVAALLDHPECAAILGETAYASARREQGSGDRYPNVAKFVLSPSFINDVVRKTVPPAPLRPRAGAAGENR